MLSIPNFISDEYISFPKVATKLAKYFCFATNGKKLIGELSYKDYDKVKDTDIIVGEIFNKPSPIEIGDKVKIIRFPLREHSKFEECDGNGFEGTIIRCSSRTFDIALATCTIINLYRNNFITINKPNTKNVIKYIKTINN